jgi:hypothetical protein
MSTAAAPVRDAAVEIDRLVGELEKILDEADGGLTRLQTGEAERGTAVLVRIKNVARDAIRWTDGGVSYRDGGEVPRRHFSP